MPGKPQEDYGYLTGYGSGAPAAAAESKDTSYGYESGYGSNAATQKTTQQNNRPSNAGIESIAQPIRDIGNAVAPYTNQAMSSPDIQPFNGLNPFTKPQGGPVQQVLGSMRQVASLPLRYSASLGQASQPVSDFIAENNQPGSNLNAGLSVALGGPYFGMKDSYQNAVANPYVSSGLGMAAGAAVDPRTWIPASGISREHPNELPLDVAQAREARTGVKAQDFQALYKDPSALFAKGDTAKAGEAIGEAKVASDINLGVQHNDLSTLTPENIQMARSPRIAGKEALQSITEDLDAARKLLPNATPGEQIALADIHPDTVNKALVESNSRLSKLMPGTDQFRAESAIKNNLQTILQNVAPDVKEANANFARLKLRDVFSGSEAVTKAGKPSKLAMLLKKIPQAVGGLIGGSLFGTAGAMGGYELGGDIANVYHSPSIAGLQTATGAVANKAVNPLLEALEKMGTSPQAQALVARYLQQQKGNQ